MRVLWPSQRRFRSFYDPASHRLSLTTDRVDDHAEGRVYAERVAITMATTGEFLDMEVLPGPVDGLSDQRRMDPTRRGEPMAVWVPEVEPPLIEADDQTGSIVLRFASATPEMWVELGDSGVLLGLVDDDVLVAVEVHPQVDPCGKLEAQWLDSLEA